MNDERCADFVHRSSLIAHRSRGASRPRAAFSLLEVILAVAILTGGVVTIGELVRIGLRSAALARDMTKAELYCESKMAEIVAGLIPAESATDIALETDPEWLYSILADTTEHPGILAVWVTVRKNTFDLRPAEFTLVRWVPDPAYAATEDTGAAL